MTPLFVFIFVLFSSSTEQVTSQTVQVTKITRIARVGPVLDLAACQKMVQAWQAEHPGAGVGICEPVPTPANASPHP